jgi:hypothetical protein
VPITLGLLIEAFVEALYFDKEVDRVKITISRLGNSFPAQDIYIACVGKGKIKGKIVNGQFEGYSRDKRRDK